MMSGSFSYTTRTITSVTDLRPGDHIRVPGSGKSGHFSRISSVSTTKSWSKRYCVSEKLAEPKHPEVCDGKSYTHHLLVVNAVKEKLVEVIHKVKGHNIIRELKWYKPADITVLDYESIYTGEDAVKRVKELMERGEEYHATRANCEHFVTEVRTGERLCYQLRNVVGVGAASGGAGVVVVGGAGVGIGALIGAGIGSVVPVAGTIIGAGAGSIIGGIIGSVVGGAAGGAGGAAGGFMRANRNINRD